ncbi:hypothetical protein PJ985_21625 [Streptomyces sp. ACA25]|uniref:hypothetical protein n=1 Tax=Streptomyces sp. ACA25 TaxID=3022596 RepID=UPI00230777E4|nr:hypothetical protein [Streptomyces sp. ACA25]MDB1090160.1 hypothetical protein [Streptomyces sp. ACA25]
MSREPRGPNEKLGTVLALAGISNAGLARRVNDLGRQRGLTLRYDKTSVARWVTKGMVPQGSAPHLIAAAIGSKLGRPVPLHEIGLADTDPTPEIGLAFPRGVPAAVRTATELYRLDSAPGRGLWQTLAGSFAVSAYATPVSRWLISPADATVARETAEGDGPPREGAARAGSGGAPGTGPAGAAGSDTEPGAAAHGPGARVGHSDVAKLQEAAVEARRWDSKYGGGDWRSSMVPQCLRSDAAPLLLGSYSEEVGRSLFRSTAELTRLAGWMAFDTGHQEAAQRYYIQALRLARAAADVPLGGYVLASMSLQATYRGFADEGVDLAQAALERNRGLATARTMSFFHLVEARAQAKDNDAVACAAALSAAESWLERSRPGDADPSWLEFYAYDRLAADAAECYADLKIPGQVRRFTAQALSEPTEEFVRSHGLRLVVAAVAELESGNLDAACAVGARAVEVANRISSARTTDYVRDLLHRLEPYDNEPLVQELREAARPLLVAPA